MHPNFDDHLRDLLDRTAHDIPDNASIIPTLHQQLARSPQQRSRIIMPQVRRFIMPLVAAMVVGALAITLIAFHPFNKGTSLGSGNGTPIATATPTVIPTSTPFTPQQVTSSGITIQFDAFDSTPLRTAVRYHIVTKPANSSDEYIPADQQLTDQTKHVYGGIGTGGTYNSGINALQEEADFLPLSPTGTPTTLTFSIAKVLFTPAEGTPISQSRTITGNWSITKSIRLQFDGATTFAAAGVTIGGITVTPKSADWLSTASTSQDAIHLQLALSGLPAGDSIQMATQYDGDQGSSSTQGDPAPSTAKLALPSGVVVTPPAVFLLSSPGAVVNPDGTTMVDVAFQKVHVKSGDVLKLTIQNLVLTHQSSTSDALHTILATWTMTITL